jgi:tetratricopeptide (TPR) repeat protein
MVSSVSLLTALIGEDGGPLSIIVQSSISSYYMMVEFHLMGYLLYQYQDKLGYAVAHEEEDVLLAAESPANVALAHVNVRLKMGDYERVLDVLHQALSKEPKNIILWQRYFDIVCKLENTASLEKMADLYFHHLLQTEQDTRLLRDIKRVRTLMPDYIPKYPHLRYRLAEEYFASGDALTAAKLLIGMHKLFPDYENLIPAYMLLKQALESIPGKQVQVAKCEVILDQLKERSTQVKEPTNELKLV